MKTKMKNRKETENENEKENKNENKKLNEYKNQNFSCFFLIFTTALLGHHSIVIKSLL